MLPYGVYRIHETSPVDCWYVLTVDRDRNGAEGVSISKQISFTEIEVVSSEWLTGRFPATVQN